jgi:hypothetical protein
MVNDILLIANPPPRVVLKTSLQPGHANESADPTAIDPFCGVT